VHQKKKKMGNIDGMVCKECVYAGIWTHTLLFDNSLTIVGTWLPSAIAICLFHPNKKVVVICGDGSFMLNFQAWFKSFFPFGPKVKMWALEIFIA
jgi:hypothetical protein